MYKGATKIIFLTTTLTASLLLASCNQAKKSSSEADTLYSQAQASYDNGDYQQSLIMLDSINKKFPSELEVLKKVIKLRPQAIEKQTLNEIVSNDSLCNVAEQKADALKGKFKYVKEPDMVEGYRTHVSSKPLFNRTGIDIRIANNDSLYIVSMLHGQSINHNCISFSCKSEERKSKVVPYNGSTNYKFSDGKISNEMVTFSGNEIDDLCNFVTTNIAQPIKLNFIGKSRVSTTLSTEEKRIIAETTQFSEAIRTLKQSEAKRLFLDNKLQIAKSQIEKTK